MLLTDHAEKTNILQNCQRIVSTGAYERVQVHGLTWGHLSPLLLSLSGKVDLIVAADCFYDTKG